MADGKKIELVREVFQEKAQLIKEGKAPKISLTKLTKVEFTKDFGYMKKGDTQNISQLAYEVYKKAKCVRTID